MSKEHQKLIKWNTVSDLTRARELVDMGILLNYKTAKKIVKNFSTEDSKSIITYISSRFLESYVTELQQEILLETLFSWISWMSAPEEGITSFLETLLETGNAENNIKKFIDIAVGMQLDLDEDEAISEESNQLFSVAVSCICELGLSIKESSLEFSSIFRNINSLLEYISTYLLSISNTQNLKVRLSLINFFSSMEAEKEVKYYLSKVMCRFGYSTLEVIYLLLFKKNSECVAMQYLNDNLPSILGCNSTTIRGVYDVWKHYLLKQPSAFCLFLKSFSTHLYELDSNHKLQHTSKDSFFTLISALLALTSQLDNQDMYYSILESILVFSKDKVRDQHLADLISKENLNLRKNLVLEVKSILKDDHLLINEFLLRRRLDRFNKKEKITKKIYQSSQELSLSQINTLYSSSAVASTNTKAS